MLRIATFAALVLICSTAFAWNATGHKITGSIAFRQLSPDQQAKIVAILKHHPRWKEDFEGKMAEGLADDDEKNEWIFQQAAIWPDLARSFRAEAREKYHRPSWHYIDLPTYLTPNDQRILEGTLTENISLVPPATEDDNMNVIQVIRLARKVVGDKDSSDEKKAVMLCWVFHDIGDIHQPLHTTALYSATLFPNGDRGGNLIKTDQRQNLHSLWDQFLGTRDTFRTIKNRVTTLLNDPEQTKAGLQAATSLNEETWLNESHMLAETVVYDTEVTGYLRGYADKSEVPPIHLSEQYLKTGGNVAQRRIVEAGYRLGAVLKQLAQ